MTPFHETFGSSVDVPATLKLDYINQKLTRWLSECSSKHSYCSSSNFISDSVCPKRLIQTTYGKVRLVELPPDSQVSYTTLSHCWGSNSTNILRTLTTNIASMRESIDWNSIPPTFQDAIRITRLLSCGYIWIDSLCIIQDDKNDWQEQSAQMAMVYSNSFLNIAATASKDSHGGLFASRVLAVNPPPQDDTRPLESHALRDNMVARIHFHQAHEPFFGTSLSDSAVSVPDFTRTHGKPFPLLQRAWVFQERMLSRRTVHFTPSEMVWECREHTRCECGGYDDTDKDIEYPRTNTKTIFSRVICGKGTELRSLNSAWRNCVAKYSQLNISMSTDWPHAMAGLAIRLVPLFKSNYIAGMWEGHFPYCLLWKPAVGTVKGYNTSTREWPFHTYSFPSGPPTWSWFNCRAAIESGVGEMKYRFAGLKSQDECADLVKFEFGDAIAEADDQQSAGFQVDHHGRPLYLTGPLQECRIWLPLSPEHPEVKVKLHGREDCEDHGVFKISLDFQAPESLAGSWYPIYCLRIYEGKSGGQESLVLAAFPGESFYVRVGTGLSYQKQNPFKDAKVCRVEVR
ncbi:heterokaryon incompatibility protein-domain-containing protein [Phyllosticta citribraziliensis]|uniref:Heterokaryon incompatibility protein-domain-containing protein n=1 Tax=Phyllosticta citribraziliensis TaxID=989973 RepID=A0ABR1L3P0_9PEZI